MRLRHRLSTLLTPFRLFAALWLLLCSAPGAWGQEVIAEWNFEDVGKRNAVNPSNFFYTADDGSAENINIAAISFYGPSFYGWVVGNGGGYAPNAENWLNGAGNHHWVIEFSTLGFESLTISSAQRTSQFQGPRDFNLEYSTDGNSWHFIRDITTDTGWGTGTISNQSLPSLLDNLSSVYIRWIQSSNLSVPGDVITGNGGTNRIDDIIITGYEVSNPNMLESITPPNPSTIEVSCGTSDNDARDLLASGTTITDTNGDPHDVGLNWSITAYNSFNPGTYNAVGTFNLPSGVEPNPDILQLVTATVIVMPGTLIPTIGTIPPICQGTVSPLFPSVTSGGNNISGSWNPSSISTGSPGTSAYTFTPAAGQCIVPGWTDNAMITIAPLPAADAGPDLAVDYGTSITLSGASAAAASVSWSPPGIFTNPDVVNPTTVELTSPGPVPVTLTVTSPEGCQSIDQMTITVGNPTLAVNPSAQPEVICLGETSQLRANPFGGTGARSYSWTSDPPGFTSNQENPPPVQPAVTTTYTVVVTAGAETVDDFITVVVKEPPNMVCTEEISVCIDAAPVDLAAYAGPAGGTFSIGGTSLPGGLFHPAAYPVGSTQQVLYNWTDGVCSGSCSLEVTVRPLPEVDAGDDIYDVANGQSVQLIDATATGAGQLAYYWSPATFFDGSNYRFLNATTIGLFEDTELTLTVVDFYNCSNTATIMIYVDDEPQPLAIDPYAASDTICAGEEVQLFANVSGGMGNKSYAWTASTGEHPEAVANPVVIPGQTTTYTVVVRDQDDAEETGTVEVTVNPLPPLPLLVGVLDDFDVCMDDPFIPYIKELLDIIGAGTYTINDEDLESFVPGDPGVYQAVYTITDSQTGCRNTKTFAITLKEVPEVYAGTDKSIPYGSGTVLTDASATVQGAGTIAFAWEPDSLFEDPAVEKPVIPVLYEPTEFTFTATYNGCQASDKVSVSVTGGPLRAFAYASLDSVCPGQQVVLTAVSDGGAEGADHSYTWTSIPEGFQASGESVTVTPEQDMLYILTVSDGINQAVDQESVMLLELPEVTCPATIIMPVNAAPVDLAGATPAGGRYTIGGDEVSALDPGSAGEGIINVQYVYTSENGCSNNCTYDIVVAEAQYTNLSVIIVPDGAGTVAGTGPKGPGEEVLLSAVAAPLWAFSHWSGSQASLLDNTSQAEVSFTMPDDQDVVLTANFVRTHYLFDLQLEGPGLIRYNGDVSYGGDTLVIAGGDCFTLSFEATEDDYVVGFVVQSYEGSRDTLYVAGQQDFCANFNADVTIEVVFVEHYEPPAYSLTLLADPPGTGTQTGAGMWLAGAVVNIGTSIPGDWKFTHWSGAGAELFGNIIHDQTTFTMPAANVTLTAHFVRVFTFQITIIGQGGVRATGDYTEDLYDPNNYIPVTQGADQSFRLMPDPDYSIVRLLVDSVEQAIPADGMIHFHDVGEAHEVEVWYEMVLYTLSYHAGVHGVLTGDTLQTVLPGADGTPVEAIADYGYMFVQWSDGHTGNPRTDTDVFSDLDVTAEFGLAYFEVTFNVSMAYARNFNNSSDRVYVTGSMFGYAMPGDMPDQQEMVAAQDDAGWLSRTVMLPLGTYYYKYFLNAGWRGEEWPSAPVRVAAVDQDVAFYDYFGSPTDPTSLASIEVDGMLVYPNPAESLLNIVSAGHEPIRLVRLINMTGQVVHVSENIRQTHYQLDVHGLTPGMYLLHVQTVFGWHRSKVQVVQGR